MTEIEVALEAVAPRAVSAVVRRDGRYLLVLRANPPAKDMYAFPGGRVDAGEDGAAAALRELAEETGIAGTDPRPFATYDLTPGASEPYLLTVFEVDEDGLAEAKALDDAVAVGWFAFADTLTLPMPPSMHQCLARLEAVHGDAKA